MNSGQIGLQDAEQRIVEFVNWVGDLMVQEVVEGVEEPTRANRIMVDGEVAVFEQVRNLRFINRFGESVVRPRRCYYHAAGHLGQFCGLLPDSIREEHLQRYSTLLYNECVLRTRLAVLNGELDRYFQPRPEVWNEAA